MSACRLPPPEQRLASRRRLHSMTPARNAWRKALARHKRTASTLHPAPCRSCTRARRSRASPHRRRLSLAPSGSPCAGPPGLHLPTRRTALLFPPLFFSRLFSVPASFPAPADQSRRGPPEPCGAFTGGLRGVGRARPGARFGARWSGRRGQLQDCLPSRPARSEKDPAARPAWSHGARAEKRPKKRPWKQKRSAPQHA